MPTIEERMAALEVEFKHINDKLNDQGADVRAIKNILAQASGGWRAIALVSGIAATLGALFGKIGWTALFG